MSLRDTLREIGRRLERAVALRRFNEADALAREYRRCLEMVPTEAPDRADVLQEAAAAFETARRMTLAARAGLAAELAELPSAPAPYRTLPPRPRHSWEMTG